MTPLYANEKTAAKLLDMDPSNFRELVKKGALPKPIKIGEQHERWQVSVLERIINGSAAVPEENQDIEI